MNVNRKEFINKMAGGFVGAVAFPFLLKGGSKYESVSGEWPPKLNPDDERFWELVRNQYPVTKNRIYLNTGGLGPASYPVLNEVSEVTMDLQSMSETGHHKFEEARAKVADYMGVSPDEICFTRNATEGNSIIGAGVPMSRGDEVIFESHAHPGGSFPWMNRQLQKGIKVKIFEPDPTSVEGNLERINKLITKRTKVIQVSHVTAPTGILFPVKEIAKLAHDKGIWFHIDGAQSAGMFPFNLKDIGCDSFATSGHKWIGAPHETGYLYVDKDKLDMVKPVEVGAYSDNGYHLPDKFSYYPTARRFEYGTRNAAAVVGVGAAIDFMNSIGMDRIANYGHGLATYLQKNLSEIKGVHILTPSIDSMYGSMTTIKADQLPYKKLYSYLGKNYNMRLRIVSERNLDAVRISTHLFTSRDNCRLIVKGVKEAVSKA